MAKDQNGHKSITEIMKDLNKKFGYTAMDMAGGIKERPRIVFKQKKLNKLTKGGIPRGQFTTIWGSSSSGKTSTVLDVIAEAQAQGLTCLYCDLEHSYSPSYAAKHGVDTSKLIYGSFVGAEDSMDAIIAFTKNKVVDLVIVDSIQGLSPIGEQEEKSGKEKSTADDTMALLARKLSQFFRMSAGHVSAANTAVIMIGQARMDLGAFIKLEKLSGGNALLHWSSLIIHMRRGQKADAPTIEQVNAETGKKENVIVGFNCVIKIDKSKIEGACEGDEMSLPFYFQHGLTDGEAPAIQTTEEKPEDKPLDNSGPCEDARDVILPEAPKKRGRKPKVQK